MDCGKVIHYGIYISFSEYEVVKGSFFKGSLLFLQFLAVHAEQWVCAVNKTHMWNIFIYLNMQITEP